MLLQIDKFPQFEMNTVLKYSLKLVTRETPTRAPSPTCGLPSCPKFMLGVDGSDTDGEPRDDVMTG